MCVGLVVMDRGGCVVGDMLGVRLLAPEPFGDVDVGHIDRDLGIVWGSVDGLQVGSMIYDQEEFTINHAI